jgi:hypothetical protein
LTSESDGAILFLPKGRQAQETKGKNEMITLERQGDWWNAYVDGKMVLHNIKEQDKNDIIDVAMATGENVKIVIDW